MEYKRDLDRHIFRGYDIRGVYGKNITEDVAYTIGLGFGNYIAEIGKTKCIVGHDNRLSSPALHDALTKGLIEAGVEVTSLGIVTTPMYYYAAIKLGIPSGIMITASHNPKDENGFKIAFDESGNAKGQEIQDFYKYIVKGNFTPKQGSIKTYDIKNDYIDLFKKSLNFGPRRVKVVIDCGNGTTSIIAKEMFSQFNIELIDIFSQSDGSFPNHHPDPSIEANLEVLKKTVLENHADVGLAFDGDGDRVGVITEKGIFIPNDWYMIIMIRSMINDVRNKTFLYDVKCSKALQDEIDKLGAKGICYRTGNSYTKSKTKEEDLPFGGELSGHVYFRDRFPGFDSGIYAGLRLVELLSKTNQTVTGLLSGINKYYSTEEIKFPSDDDKKFEVVEKVNLYANEKGYKTLTIDGVKVLFDDGWALVRASNTGPNLTARFEASTQERLQELQQEFTSIINEYNK